MLPAAHVQQRSRDKLEVILKKRPTGQVLQEPENDSSVQQSSEQGSEQEGVAEGIDRKRRRRGMEYCML